MKDVTMKAKLGKSEKLRTTYLYKDKVRTVKVSLSLNLLTNGLSDIRSTTATRLSNKSISDLNLSCLGGSAVHLTQ